VWCRYTILDAPGHKNYVPNMIAGAAQADVGVLVISARRGEFETGFDRGGQTREHALLAKTLGVKQLVVAINKMDNKTVNWAKDRFDHCKKKLDPFLKSSGFNTKKHVHYVPLSALTGDGVKDNIKDGLCPWWSGYSLLQQLDKLKISGRDPDAPCVIPVLDRYTDRGLVRAAQWMWCVVWYLIASSAVAVSVTRLRWARSRLVQLYLALSLLSCQRGNRAWWIV